MRNSSLILKSQLPKFQIQTTNASKYFPVESTDSGWCWNREYQPSPQRSTSSGRTVVRFASVFHTQFSKAFSICSAACSAFPTFCIDADFTDCTEGFFSSSKLIVGTVANNRGHVLKYSQTLIPLCFFQSFFCSHFHLFFEISILFWLLINFHLLILQQFYGKSSVKLLRISERNLNYWSTHSLILHLNGNIFN